MVKQTETTSKATVAAAAEAAPASNQDSTGMLKHEGDTPNSDNSGSDLLTTGQGNDLLSSTDGDEALFGDELDNEFEGDDELDDELDDDFDDGGPYNEPKYSGDTAQPGSDIAHREIATAPHTTAPIGEHQVDNPYLSADQKKPFLDPHEHSHGTGPEAPGPVGAGEDATLREGNDQTSTNDEIDEHRNPSTAPGQPQHAVTAYETGKDEYTGETDGKGDKVPDSPSFVEDTGDKK